MKKLVDYAISLRIWRDQNGQDLIEYALMGGFVVATAGAVMPEVATQISVIFSKVDLLLSSAGAELGH